MAIAFADSYLNFYAVCFSSSNSSAPFSSVTFLPQGIDSKPFCVGGSRWRFTYYPNGYQDSTTGLIASAALSLFIRSCNHV